MTPREYQKEIHAFVRTIGPRAEATLYASTTFGPEGVPLHSTLYLNNQKRRPFDPEFTVEAETFPELLEAFKIKWKEHEAVTRQRIIRAIALAIIKITAEHGTCSDAALRQDFDDSDVVRYGHEAVIDANAIADKGPFCIIHLGKANNQ